MGFKSLSPNLMVEDVQHAIAFYRDVLGFEVAATAPDADAPVWAMVRSGEVSVMLEARSSIEEGMPQLAGKSAGGTLSLYMDVDDADALHAAIHDRVRIVKEPHLTFYGAREFYILDQDGYILGFASQQEHAHE